MPKIDQSLNPDSAQGLIFEGVRAGSSVFEIEDAIRELAGSGRWGYGLTERLLALGIGALELGGFSSEDPLEYEGLRERYLPEAHFRGKTAHRNSQYAFYAIAAIRGGLQPDIGADTGWWQSELWPWVLCALVALLRAGAEHRGVEVSVLTEELAAKTQHTVS